MKKTAIAQIKPHLISVLVITVLCCAYFFPQLQGKKIAQTDIVNSQYMVKEALDFRKATGTSTHWTNTVFCGMPTYQIASPVRSNFLKYVEQATYMFFDRPIGYFIGMMIGMYILLITLGVNHWLALIGAIGLGFTTNNFVLFEAGHTSKMRAVAFLAPMIAGMLMTYRGKYLWGGVLFAMAAGVELYTNHPQMTYYFAIIASVYVLFQFVEDVKKGNIVGFAKASGILVLGTLLALGASWSKINSTLEYAKDTMRGTPILETKGEATSSSHTKGLEWGYAMQWSNGVRDLGSTVIPGFVGGGSSEKVSSKSAFSKKMRQFGQRGDKAPLYWGGLPSTSGPNYLGASFMFFFILGLFLVKGKLRWWLLIGVIFTFLLSLGKNFEGLHRIFFDYFPLFNSFRAPSSILSVTAVLVPILGILGVSNIIENKVSKEEATKAVIYSVGILGAFCLIFGFGGSAFFDFAGSSDASLKNPQIGDQLLNAVISDRKSLLMTDALRSLGIILALGGLIWAYTKGKISQTILLAGLGLITLGDLWTVGKRYLGNNAFKSVSTSEAAFRPNAADQQILKDKDPNFRVFDLQSGNPFVSSRASYFHKSIGGYHPAKLQRIADMIDFHIAKGNQAVMNMLNTKYIITREGKAQQNPNAFGNAWFVNTIQQVNSPNEEIESLDKTDLATTAIVLNEFSDYVSGLSPNKTAGSIKLTDYKPNKLTYSANSTAENFAVFSEVWYGPNKGWQAYIDGEPVDHIRANYILRGLKIPAGQHEVVFEFKPKAFLQGETISFASSGIVLLAFFGLLFLSLKNWYAELPETVAAAVEKAPAKKTVSKKKKKK